MNLQSLIFYFFFFQTGAILIACLMGWMFLVDINVLLRKAGETKSIVEVCIVLGPKMVSNCVLNLFPPTKQLIWMPSLLLVASSASHAFSWTKLIEWQGSTGTRIKEM
jgi:hypothetical protein